MHSLNTSFGFIKGNKKRDLAGVSLFLVPVTGSIALWVQSRLLSLVPVTGSITLRCCRRQAGGKQQSTGLLHYMGSIPVAFLVPVTGSISLRCCRRQAGGKQQSTGLLHYMGSIPATMESKKIQDTL